MLMGPKMRKKKIKKYLKKRIIDAGEKGIKLDRLLDAANRNFMNVYVSDQLIIDLLKNDNDIEMFFIPFNTRTLYAFRAKK